MLRLVMDMLPFGNISSSVNIALRLFESLNVERLFTKAVPEVKSLRLIILDGREDEISSAGEIAIMESADKHHVNDLASCLPKLAATANAMVTSIIRGV